MSDVAAIAATTPTTQPASQSSGPLGFSLWSKGGFSFKDLLDIVNPLQHLPVVGSIYRYLTGDEPAAGTRIIGDALYGGPIGFGVSVVSTALLTDSGGHDLGERLLAGVFGPRDHDNSTPTLGTPQVATAADGEPAPMPAWMASVGTPDGQPATPPPARQASAQPSQQAARVAGATLPTKPMGYVPGSRSTPSAAPAARSIASAAAPLPMSSPAPAAAPQPLPAQAAAAQAATPQAVPAQPVPVTQLFQSAPAANAGTPEQAFIAQNSQLQRQISQGRGSNGAVLNNRPVPLELSSSLLPVMPAGGHLTLGPGVAAGPANASQAMPSSSPAQAGKPAAGAPDQAAISQKMIDALNKYQQLKKQEQQQDSAEKADQAKVDLSL